MSCARPAFDLDAPFVVASQELVCRGERLLRGAPFPWRELGFSPADVGALWLAFQIDNATDVDPPTDEALVAADGVTNEPAAMVAVEEPHHRAPALPERMLAEPARLEPSPATRVANAPPIVRVPRVHHPRRRRVRW